MTDGNQILDQIRAAGRRVLPMHEYLAEHHAEGLDGYNRFLTSTIYDNQALEPRYRELILACICVAAGSAQAVVANHCRKAMEYGADRTEVIQAIEMTAAVMATRAMGAGMTALIEADTETTP